jgi:hypothetical protein
MTERHRQPDRRRLGSAYVMILGVSAVLMVIGLAAVSVARIDNRNVSADNDWSEAQTLALSAAENALARIAVTDDWRSRLAGVVTVPMGHGTMQWQITDDGDGQLADDEQDPVLIVAIGQVGASRYKLGLRCLVEGRPLEALARCVHGGGDITMDTNSRLTVTGGAASTNGDFRADKDTAELAGDLEADGVWWKKNVTGNVSKHATPLTMPSAGVVDTYRAMATDISGRTLINRQAIGPGRNPWGAANADGVYYLNATGADVTLRDSRIIGTLVVRCRRLTIDNNVLLESFRKDMPALIVDGDLVLNYQSTGSQLRENDADTNFNPVGVPYGGLSDSDKSDSYPSEVRGLVHVRGDLTLKGTALVRGAIVCDGKVQCGGTNQIVHDADLSTLPVIGYTSGDGRLYRAGWTRLID